MQQVSWSGGRQIVGRGRPPRQRWRRSGETHGLLTHQEVRRTREALGVTPDEFDQLLGLPSGISKGWEVQRHLQNRAADARIRALQDVEYAKGVAIGARVTLRLTDEERAAYKPPAFLKRKGAAAISAEALEETPVIVSRATSPVVRDDAVVALPVQPRADVAPEPAQEPAREPAQDVAAD
ncbi:MAG: hypothetical protein IPK33_06450 [Gemmatimonadetes bacterium]|nr:hypothetical protein [Gemmatimonadota bacterium]